MLSENKIRQNGSSFIVTAFVFWCAAAVLTLFISALTLNKVRVSAAAVGLISSLLSFICGISAGFGAALKRSGGALYSGLVAGVSIVTVLLSVGFLAEGSDISPDGVLSVVSFTLSGCLLGTIIQVNGKKPQNRSKRNKRRFSFT